MDVGAAPATAPTVQGTPGAIAGLGRDATPLQVRTASRYEMVGEHGRGGLGRVMRAHDRELGRTVAIKELLRRGRTAELRFLREALITARLEHPAIVPVHEAGRWADGTPFYSMKLVAGRPLRDLIDDAASADDPLAARLALVPHVVAVADAIAYAHARRIVHRDLKPSNVIVGDYGETVVIDWGLAKDLSAGEREDVTDPYRAPALPEVTEAGAVMGTPAFMAPEQARGEPGDERADVYALGAMLYAVLAGQPPYQGTRSTDIVRAVVDGPPTPLAELAPVAPADLVAIAAAAMERDAGRRLGSAKAFADELHRYLRGQQVLSRRYSTAEKILRWTRRHRELSAAVVVGLAMLAAVGAAAVSRVVDERDAADRERRRAEAALADARAQREGLILGHARVEAERDPTAALAWLAAYDGPDAAKAQELAALATGHGAALFSRNRDGKRLGAAVAVSFSPPEVLTVGADRTLRRWQARQRGATVVATAIGGPTGMPHARSPRGELALVRGDDVVVQGAGGAEHATRLPGVHVLAYAPDGALLAATDHELALLGPPPRRIAVPADVGRPRSAAVARSGAIALCDERSRLWSISPSGAWSALGPCAIDLAGGLSIAGDGRTLAAIADGRVQLHDLAGGRPRPVLGVADAALVLFLADGQLVVGGRGGAVHIVDRRGQRRALLALEGAVARVAEASDGRLAVGFRDGSVRVVNPASGDVAPVPGFRSTIGTLQWSADGRRLLVADLNEIRIVAPPRRQRWATGADASGRAVYAPDGRWLVADTVRGDIAVVPRPGTALRRLRGHTGTSFDLAIRAEGLVSASIDGSVRVWDIATGASRLRPTTGPVVRMAGAGPGPIYTVDAAGVVAAVAPDGGAVRPLHTSPHAPRYLALSPDGRQLVLLGAHGHLDLVHTATGEVVPLGIGATPSSAVAWSPDGSFFVTGSHGGRIEVRAAGGERLHLGQYGARCGMVTVSVAGEIAAACGRLLVRLRRVDGRWWASWRSLESDLYVVAYSADGRRLAATSVEGSVYVVDAGSGALAAARLAPTMVTSAVFSPDGRELAATTYSESLMALAVDDLTTVPADAGALAAWLAERRDDDITLPIDAPSTPRGLGPQPTLETP